MKGKILAPWKKSYDQPRQHIKKQRHYFASKDSFRQNYSFSSSQVRMWDLDHKGWMLNNWCFPTVVLEKTLESPLNLKDIKSFNLKEISPECSLAGLMLKLMLQYFGHLLQRADSLEKPLMLGKIEGRRRRGWQRMRCWMASKAQWKRVWTSSKRWWRTGKPGMLQSMGLQRVRQDWATDQQSIEL